MNSEIVHHDGPVLLVGGGECTDSVLEQAVCGTTKHVAADGGALKLLGIGVLPDAVIGDLDSFPEDEQANLPDGILHRISEQDSTDFDKSLRNISAPLVLGYGFTGARTDHLLAVLTVLCRHADRRCVIVGEEDVTMLCPPRLSLDLPPGTQVSLYPMGAVTGRSKGLRWPIDGLELAPDARVGTSNEALGPVTLDIDAPRLLLILPLTCLAALTQALEQEPSAWPARA